MAVEIIMPKVDMVMETGTFIEWLKKEGDQVAKGEPLFVIMTDKAAIEAEAPESGILAGITAKPDDVIPVTTVIGYILGPGESLPQPAMLTIQLSNPATNDISIGARTDGDFISPIEKPSTLPEGEIQVRATPVARALAKEMNINLSSIVGRGPRGRVQKTDVLAYANDLRDVTQTATSSQSHALASSFAAVLPANSQQISLPDARIRQRFKLKGPRAVIAQRMSYSWTSIPHIYETLTVNMSEVVRMRERIGPTILEAIGRKISYTVIMAYAVARLLTRHPGLNSTLIGDEVIQWEDVHLGLATSLEDYLIVPVIREAQKKSLQELVAEMSRLLDEAYTKRLAPNEMNGSTFTITNLGMYGIEQFTAIINSPESAILAIGKMKDTPIVIDGRIEVRPIMTLTLAVDHRVIDGAAAARFLTDMKNMLENPYLLL